MISAKVEWDWADTRVKNDLQNTMGDNYDSQWADAITDMVYAMAKGGLKNVKVTFYKSYWISTYTPQVKPEKRGWFR